MCWPPGVNTGEGCTVALTCWSRSSPSHSRWCFIVGHKWLSASVCLPASNLWFRDSLGGCTSSDSADNSIWENDPSFLVRHKISHLTFKLLTRGTWKKEELSQPSWCFLSSGSLGLMQADLKADLTTMVLPPNRRCWSNPSSGTSTSRSSFLEHSLGLVLVARAADIFPPQGFHQTLDCSDCEWHGLGHRGGRTGCDKGFRSCPGCAGHRPQLEDQVCGPNAFVIANSSGAHEAATNEPKGRVWRQRKEWEWERKEGRLEGKKKKK